MYCTCVLQWSWQTLLWGIGLQFVFGLLILRTTFGFRAVQWIGKQAEVHTHTHTQTHTHIHTQCIFCQLIVLVLFTCFCN